jgi:glycosyltransferase 2 family protein
MAGRRRWIVALKTAVGLGLLAFLLLWKDNGHKLLVVFIGFRVEFILALLLIALALAWVSCIKWGLFVRDRGAEASHARLFGLYLIGYFFNNFLPSTIGGDAARVYLLGRDINSQSASFASVFMERATGVLALTVLAAAFALVNPALLANPIIALAIAGALLGCTISTILFFRPALLQLALGRLHRLPGLTKVAALGERLIGDITRFRHRHRLLLRSLVWSASFHLLASLNVYVACLSIGFAPSFLDVLVVTPVVLLLTTIPVSPNNIGWWEWCFSVLLLDAGATAAEGLAVALTLRAATMSISLLGGLLFLRWRVRRPAA